MERNLQLEAEPDCAEKVKEIGRDVAAVSGVALIFGLVGFLQTWPHPMGELGHFMHDSGVFTLFVGPWGLATGIGLSRSWRWARISMLVFSAPLGAFGTVLAVGILVWPIRDVPVWHLILVKALGVSLFGIVAAIGVLWLIYFTRDNVKAYFRASH